MKRIFLLCAIISLVAPFSTVKGVSPDKGHNYTLYSPERTYKLSVSVTDKINFYVETSEESIVSSTISMTVKPSKGDIASKVLGELSTIRSSKTTSHSTIIESPFYRKSQIEDKYNQLEIFFREGFSLQFRAYESGIAYRFCTSMRDSLYITNELSEFQFNKDNICYVPYSSNVKQPFQTSFESRYDISKISDFKLNGYAFLPLLVSLNSTRKVLITESDLESYPGMFLTNNQSNNGFISRFAPIPYEKTVHPQRGQEKVTSYTNILAKVSGTRTFPWRIIAISENDTELPVNDLVYLLASPCRIGDISWIHPGKVAWDWWNAWGVTGVDFPVGINTQTYKYFIDFASANSLEYIILDEGWSEPSKCDIMSVIPEIDLKEIIEYGKTKNVGVILWSVAYVLDKKLEEACRTYSEMGVKGFKIDFMNRDDQEVVDMNYRILETAAKYHLVIDFHGMYKPTGLNRTYPNLLNYEGVWGLEQMKWSEDDQMTYDVTFPFIRMMAGPVDYTQGAMRNATKRDFKPVYSNPSSQGTRAHQVGTYIVFDSPLVMLADSPTAYIKEQETTDFIKDIPTVWDETRILSGKVGEYIVTARRSGNKWYIGALTGSEARDITVDLSFIGEGDKNVTIFKDGVNAHRLGTDYKIENINHTNILTLHLAPGGGFAIKIN